MPLSTASAHTPPGATWHADCWRSRVCLCLPSHPALAGRAKHAQPQPHGQLPPLPELRHCGRPALPGEPAQQPLGRPLRHPACAHLPAARNAPVHPGECCGGSGSDHRQGARGPGPQQLRGCRNPHVVTPAAPAGKPRPESRSRFPQISFVDNSEVQTQAGLYHGPFTSCFPGSDGRRWHLVAGVSSLGFPFPGSAWLRGRPGWDACVLTVRTAAAGSPFLSSSRFCPCCRWPASGPTSSPPPAPWPEPSRCSPTAPARHGARRRRRSPWSFSWWDKTTGRWKCPLCKWVSGRSDSVPGPCGGVSGGALPLLQGRGVAGRAPVVPEKAPGLGFVFRRRFCAASGGWVPEQHWALPCLRVNNPAHGSVTFPFSVGFHFRYFTGSSEESFWGQARLEVTSRSEVPMWLNVTQSTLPWAATLPDPSALLPSPLLCAPIQQPHPGRPFPHVTLCHCHLRSPRGQGPAQTRDFRSTWSDAVAQGAPTHTHRSGPGSSLLTGSCPSSPSPLPQEGQAGHVTGPPGTRQGSGLAPAHVHALRGQVGPLRGSCCYSRPGVEWTVAHRCAVT